MSRSSCGATAPDKVSIAVCAGVETVSDFPARNTAVLEQVTDCSGSSALMTIGVEDVLNFQASVFAFSVQC